METTEQCWSLKVRYKRDVAEQALSLCYTAGSVTTDCSPAPLLFLYVHSRSQSQILLFLPFICLSLSQLSFRDTFSQFLCLSTISCVIAFLFLDYCGINLFYLCLAPLSPSVSNI